MLVCVSALVPLSSIFFSLEICLLWSTITFGIMELGHRLSHLEGQHLEIGRLGVSFQEEVDLQPD